MIFDRGAAFSGDAGDGIVAPSTTDHATPHPMSMPIPPELLDLFDEPALGHISYTSDSGQIITFPLWVDHADSRILASSPVGSTKGQAVRERPQVGVSIVSTKTPWRWLSISGRVVRSVPTTSSRSSTRCRTSTSGRPMSAVPRARSFVIEIDRVGHSGSWGS